MLCFVFAALVVLLDQFIKRWVVLTLPLSDKTVLIPGIIGLTHVENRGASFGMLSDSPWVLVGVACLAVLLLAAILLRYNDGFWGTLGLAAVLGGAVGNLIDRLQLVEHAGVVAPGKVVDMFEFYFVRFAIFNIADIFITLGGLTFIVFFIISTIKQSRKEESLPDSAAAAYTRVEQVQGDNQIGLYDFRFDEDPQDRDEFGFDSNDDVIPDPSVFYDEDPELPPEYFENEEADYEIEEPPGGETSVLDALNEIETELTETESLEDYDVDRLLREYGFENDDGN